MSPWQILRVALIALGRNKLRSILTALGVVFGVGAVIAMVAVGDGARAQVQAAFAAMGDNLLVVMSGSARTGGARGGAGSQPTLTWDDLAAIQNEASAVRYAAPLLRSSAQVLSEEQNWSTQVQGTSPDYFHIRDWAPAQGELFSAADVDGGAKVAVLGQTVAQNLFAPGESAVGQRIRINNVPFTVVGVLQAKGQSGMGQDNDDVVLVPTSVFLAKIQGGMQQFLPGVIFVAATSSDTTSKAEDQITTLLRDRHRIRSATDDDFTVRNMAEIAGARQESTNTLTLLLAIIAAVSLVVGGIGIMNIMLVSVTERTREIGIRMAVGAKPRHVLAQFVSEAVALSTVGGLLGVGIGVLVATELAAIFGWPVRFQSDIVFLAVGFSGAVGIGFGLYPALKASKLDPIQALRYE